MDLRANIAINGILRERHIAISKLVQSHLLNRVTFLKVLTGAFKNCLKQI